MGSFAFTCTVSGLPIEVGDPVRYLLLTKNPFHENDAAWSCYIDSRWYVRSFPFASFYNDYGSIETGEIGQPYLADLMLEGLNMDMIERGVGDNSCHDVPVRRGMGLKEILNALWEARVLVPSIEGYRLRPQVAEKLGATLPKQEPSKYKRKVHPGIPTMRRVRKAIKEAGMPLSDGQFGKGFTVGRMFLGYIRVRSEGEFGHEAEELTKLQAVLDQQGRFATVLTSGTGTYSHDKAELLVLPKPYQGEDSHGYGASFGPHPPYSGSATPVAQAMIREDVWQALCGMTLQADYRNIPSTVEEFRALAKAMWDICLEHEKSIREPVKGEEESLRKASRMFEFRDTLRLKNILADILKDKAGVGLRAHFDLMIKKELDGKLTPEVVTDFLSTVGETAFVHFVLSPLRYQWHPSSGQGPQFGEWAMHLEYLTRLQGVAAKLYTEKRDDFDDIEE